MLRTLFKQTTRFGRSYWGGLKIYEQEKAIMKKQREQWGLIDDWVRSGKERRPEINSLINDYVDSRLRDLLIYSWSIEDSIDQLHRRLERMEEEYSAVEHSYSKKLGIKAEYQEPFQIPPAAFQKVLTCQDSINRVKQIVKHLSQQDPIMPDKEFADFWEFR